jgi:hypothetical protein
MIWYTSKQALEKNKHEHCIIPLARDTDYNENSKTYTWCKSQEEVVNIIETSDPDERHYNEIFMNTTSYPSFLYFDIDRYIDSSGRDNVPNFDNMITTFLRVTQRFINEIYKIDINLELGKNTHICYSVTDSKYSAHVRINIKCVNLQVTKSVVTNLCKYIISNVHCSNEERFILTYIKTSKIETKSTTIIDTAVYNTFSLFRTIYSSKWKSGGTHLLPYKNSSKQIKNHLTLWTDFSNPSYVIPIISEEIEFAALGDYSKLNEIILHPLARNNITKSEEKSKEKQQDISPYIHNSKLQAIEESIMNNKHIQELIKCQDIRFAYNTFFNANNYNFCIDKRCNHYCPYAGRIHRHNRSYFQYNFTTQML